MKYLVAVPIPEPWRGRLMSLKAEFRPAGWRDTMEPHITVLAPDSPILEPNAASNAFAQANLNLPPFTITARRLHRFSRHHRHTVVLVPDDPSALIKLFTEILTRCDWQETMTSTRRPYQPHITLVNQVSDEQLESIEEQLSHLDPNVEFECRRLTLYAKQTRWPTWRELHSLNFSDQS